jgi:hypothetical protein
LRTAVLDALAHEFKTPLTVVRTASSGLLAVGGLSELQAELIGMIDRQASHLDQLASTPVDDGAAGYRGVHGRNRAVLFSELYAMPSPGWRQDADRKRFRWPCPPAKSRFSPTGN